MPLQKLDKIELRAKPVTTAPHFSWAGLDDADVAELAIIIDSIQRGYGVPNSCYRAGLGATPDALLSSNGIMHIHLGGKTGNSLIYLMQFDDEVVLMRAGGHLFHEPNRSQLKTYAARLKSAAERREQARKKAKQSALADSISKIRKPKTPPPDSAK